MNIRVKRHRRSLRRGRRIRMPLRRRLGGGDGALGAPRRLRGGGFALAQLLQQPPHHRRPPGAVGLEGLAQGRRRSGRREASSATLFGDSLLGFRRGSERGVDGIRRRRRRRREARGALRAPPRSRLRRLRRVFGSLGEVLAARGVPGDGHRHRGAPRALRHFHSGQEEVVPAETRPLLRGRGRGVEPTGAVDSGPGLVRPAGGSS